MILRIECWRCERDYAVTVGADDYDRWKRRGEHAQDVFPYLSDDQRELLISKTCGSCWEEVFNE